jgi:hypothetical protein
VGLPGDPINSGPAADGTPQARAFIVTFDRPIDPSTFRPEDVQVFFRDTTPGNTTGGPVPVVNVSPLDLGDFGPAGAHGATRFRVDFAPRSGVGTYSYTVGPAIEDRIRSVGFGLTPIQTTNASATSPQVPRTFNNFGPTPSVTTSTIPIAGIPAGQVITDVNVTLRIDYPFTGDLRLTLIAPDGTRIVLADQQPTASGGFGSGFINTTFDDQAGQSITSPAACSPAAPSRGPSRAGRWRSRPGSWR